MKILVDYLEKYVEWLVLGLAVLWVGWVAMAYWLEQPVMVSVQGQEMPPEKVDTWTARTLVPQFQAVKDAKPTESFPPLAFLATFQQQLLGQVQPVGGETGIAMRVPAPPGSDFNVTAPTTSVAPQNIGVLAAVVPPVLLGLSEGKTVVLLPQTGTAGAPAAVAPGAPAAAAPPPTSPTDVVWVTLDAKYPAAEQDKAYTNANIPIYLLTNSPGVPILRVVMQREQLMPNGTWGNPQDIVPPFGDFGANPPPPYPAPGDIAAAQVCFNYAASHESLLVEPPFYQSGPAPSGDTWWSWLNGDPNLNKSLPVIAPPPPIQPVTPPPPRPRPTTPTNQNTNTPPQQHQSSQGHRGGRGQHAPMPTGGSIQYSGPAGALASGEMPSVQTPVRSGRADYPPGYPPPPISPYASGGPNQPGVQPAAPLPGQPTGQPMQPPITPGANGAVVPNGAKLFPPPDKGLDPTTQQPFEIWAHDVGIVGQPGGPQPGCTYRYRMVVKIYNPLYNFPQVCKDAKDAKQYDLVGTTVWSDPIIIPRLRYFYVADNGMGDGVKIDLFEWKGGRWTVQTLQRLKPGDSIGDTGATVVDLRPDWHPDSDGKIVLIATADGKLEERTYRIDNNNPLHKELRQRAFVVQASVTSATPPGGY